MATAGTDDSDLLFQFNTPINSSLPYFYGETRDLVGTGLESHAEDDGDTDRDSDNGGNASRMVQEHTEDSNQPQSATILTHMAANSRRLNPQRYHSTVSVAIDNTKALSQYNNYLNDKFSHKRKLSQDSELIRLRQKKLEELVDKFWLKDGEIDESMFDSSSDEE